jgi:hypothetical protein
MKQLLYIPNSNYISFYIKENTMGSLEEYTKKWNVSEQFVINKILDGTFSDTFFDRNGLPSKDQLEKNHFEIINK